MTINTIIFDLDNTIYPVASIGNQLFKSLFEIIESDGRFQGPIEEIKFEIMRTPFQIVAKKFQFNESLTDNCLNHLINLVYQDSMYPFPGYEITKSIPLNKFLVTSGFTKMQQSKIKQLGIKDNFKEIFILDLTIKQQSKQEIFKQIIEKYNLKPTEVLVIGDDIHSEIQAGKNLGLKTVIYDYLEQHSDLKDENVITNYSQLLTFI